MPEKAYFRPRSSCVCHRNEMPRVVCLFACFEIDARFGVRRLTPRLPET